MLSTKARVGAKGSSSSSVEAETSQGESGYSHQELHDAPEDTASPENPRQAYKKALSRSL